MDTQNNNQQHSIEALKAFILYAYECGDLLVDALSDKKVSIWEGFAIFGKLTQLPKIANAELLAELNELSADEREELASFVASKLNINIPDAQEVVANSLDLALHLYDFVRKILKRKK